MNIQFPSLCLLCALLCSACGQNGPAPAPVSSAPQQQAVPVPKPSFASAAPDSLIIPVYKRFADFAPLLQKDNDTVYVVNFWATWCAPCVAELPHFERLQARYGAQNVQVLLVSLDDDKVLARKVVPFVQARGLRSAVVLLDDVDYNSWIDRVSPEWSGAIPATYIFKGQRHAFYEQSFEYDDLEKALQAFL